VFLFEQWIGPMVKVHSKAHPPPTFKANTCKIKLTRQPFFFPLHWVIYRLDILCSHPARGSGGRF